MISHLLLNLRLSLTVSQPDYKTPQRKMGIPWKFSGISKLDFIVPEGLERLQAEYLLPRIEEQCGKGADFAYLDTAEL